MILNVSYNDPKITRTLNTELGPAYSMLQRIKLGGTGSPRLIIHDCSEHFNEYLHHSSDLPYANIELRPRGLLLRFRYLLETMAWLLPAQGLVWKTNGDFLVLSSGDVWLSLRPAGKNLPEAVRFMEKAEIRFQV